MRANRLEEAVTMSVDDALIRLSALLGLDPDRGGDEIMLPHLAPRAGHRQRIIRLLYAAGRSAPRHAPRAFNPDIRRL
jgi:hypothetical protein